jgi:mono/diheme cytochrome c family protein
VYYPEDLEYPVRTDPLVVKTPESKPPTDTFDKPGQFLHQFDDLNFPLLAEKNNNIYIVRFPEIDPRTGKVGVRERDREKLGASLNDLFGTPRFPKVTTIDKMTRKTLKLDKDTLEEGSRLYRLHCVHCHGLSGDGRGPTAPWVNPHPRDYRKGIFKFTSSKQPLGVRKPLRSDLLRTLREGIEGTSMPSFRELPTKELDALASYVIHLSLRGQVEFEIMNEKLLNHQKVGNFKTFLRGKLKEIATSWVEANNNKITPGVKADYPVLFESKGDTLRQVDVAQYKKDSSKLDRMMRASVHGGLKTFKSLCITCHFDYGRQSQIVYDAWATLVRPTNLTTGVYRGGRRPIDLYYRIHSGINGSNMAKLEGSQESDGLAYEKKIWDLINFLRVLPYPKMRERYGIEIN